ncbi:MAG: DUF2232 domain-containing protein [Bdellovibrionales bacterium]|nr:DUF2232 domain-containing protein [Bdellovibrionales bacterium]
MIESTRKTKSALLILWAFILASLTFSLGAIPLNGLYRSMGRLKYWMFWSLISTVIFAMGFPALAAGLVAICVVVGIFNEVRIHGYSYLSAGFISVLFTSSIVFAGAYVWAKAFNVKWYLLFEEYLNKNITAFFPQSADSSAAIDIKQLIMQIPSAGVILLVLSLFMALLFERRMMLWLDLPVLQRERLITFKLPDSTIWVFIFSLLLAFIKTDISWVNVIGLNLLNVVSLLYFFQGLAVVATYMKITKTSPFWRSVIYIFVILQLFIAVVALGVMDFWFDFRLKMIKKAAEIKTQKKLE